MSVVIGDLPPLTWHAELGRSLPDLWSGTRHRGVQLHDLRQAVMVWSTRYGQLDRPATSEMQDAVLRTIARMDGTPFLSTARLVSRWLPGGYRLSGARPEAPTWGCLLRGGARRHLAGHGTPARQARAWLA
jgi:hypothetical protein